MEEVITTRSDLNHQEKIDCYYSSIDLTKVNKESKFNKWFCEVQEFLEDGYHICGLSVSAELYTKEEARKMFCKHVGGLDEANTDESSLFYCRTIQDVRIKFVCKRFSYDFERRVRTCYDGPPEKICNRYKPVFYLYAH